MPGASQHTSAAILSSLAFDKSAEVFASAGVSKRIFVYNFREAVEAYRQNPSRQVIQEALISSARPVQAFHVCCLQGISRITPGISTALLQERGLKSYLDMLSNSGKKR